ncbi:hypothetical protein JCM19000A_00510 [Silvimonas sp. JCM 19000]
MTISLIPGVAYRLTENIRIGNCAFNTGDAVTFSSGGYSPYDDCYIYNFVTASGEKHMCVSQSELTADEIRKFSSDL